jgi:hypothetical protein
MADIPYYSDVLDMTHTCRSCDWQGTGSEADREYFTGLIQVDCPSCGGRLFLVPLPSAEDTRRAAAAGSENAKRNLPELALREQVNQRVEASRLRSGDALPDLEGEQLDFYLALFDEDTVCTILALVTGHPDDWAETVDDPRVIHTECCYYEDPEPVQRLVCILQARYGSRFRYLRTDPAMLYLEGDDTSAYHEVDEWLGAHKAPQTK